MGYGLLAAPLAAVLLILLMKDKKWMHGISLLAFLCLLVNGSLLTREVILFGEVSYAYLGGFFYADALSVIALDLVLLIGFITNVYSIGYMEEEQRRGRADEKRLRIYYVLMHSFVFTMILALTADNMGIMWIAIEATTLASAFLVGFHNDRHSLEAAWKYVIICSVGIVIALLGIIFLHLSSMGEISHTQHLDWTALYREAGSLSPPVLRLSFIFILVGFGTKAGLAPMHTWLPDAHSQAPSPISAMLSGVLLNSAMYAIIRTVAIINRCLGDSGYTGRLLIAMGVLSMGTAAIFILTQKEYKRLLAYSSIEHMGIIAIALGMFTPLSVFGGLLHMINHSLTKSMLFLSAGNILQKYDTKKITRINGAIKLLPVSGTAFLLGLFAIAGTPPFSVFASELSILISIFDEKSFLLGALIVGLLALVFVGIALSLFRMFHGDCGDRSIAPGEINRPGTAAILVLLAAILITGVIVPEGLLVLIGDARDIILGR